MLLNATSDEDSMGNASMVQTGIVRVSEKGKVTLEMTFQSMKFAGMTGYLYKLKKVDMDSVKYNKYNYPIEYTASDATVLEEYTDVYIYLMTRIQNSMIRIQKVNGIRKKYLSRLT